MADQAPPTLDHPALPSRRRGWPHTAGDGVPADTPVGHLNNARGALQAYRQAYGLSDLPAGLRVLLESVERRCTLAVRGLELVEADWSGGLHLVRGCACVANSEGQVIEMCTIHDPDDTGRRND